MARKKTPLQRYQEQQGYGSLADAMGNIGNIVSNATNKPRPKPKPILGVTVQKPGTVSQLPGGKPGRPGPRPVKDRGPGSGNLTVGDLASGGYKPKPKPRPKPSGGKAPSRVVTRNGVRTSVRAGGGSGGPTGGSGGVSGGGGVRRGGSGGGRRGAAPAGPQVDPIKAIVDDIIAGMNQPLEEQRRQLVEQSAGNIDQTNRLHDFYAGQVGGIREDANADFGAALARAAELKGISASTVGQWQEFAKGLAAPGNGGTGQQQIADAAGHTASDLAAVNDSLTRDIAAEGQSLSDVMAQLQVAGRAGQREMNQQELLRRSAGQREIDAAKAANSSQRGALTRQIQNEERDAALKQQVAQAEWGLKSAQAQSLDEYRQGQLALGAAKLQQQAAADAAKATKPPAPGRYGNIPKRYDAAIKSVWDDLNRRFSSDDGLPAPWRTAHQALVDQGLDPSASAFLATKWFKDSITGSTADNIRKMLANRGVSVAAQRRIIMDHFGPNGWRQSQATGLGGAVAGAGNIIRDATR